MTDDATKLARENIDAFNAGDWQRFKATLAADSVYSELATQRSVRGPDEIAAISQGWKSAIPDDGRPRIDQGHGRRENMPARGAVGPINPRRVVWRAGAGRRRAVAITDRLVDAVNTVDATLRERRPEQW